MASLVAQRLKVCLQCRRTGLDPWVGKIPWRRKWQPIPVLLLEESYGVRRLVGYSPWGCKELDTTERLHFHFTFIAKFRLKLKKVGKTTRPFRYDLNQIPYDYTVEVRNRFKGLDLIDRVPDELWTEVQDILQKTGIKTIPMEKKCKKAKWLSGEALQIAVKRRDAKSKGEK